MLDRIVIDGAGVRYFLGGKEVSEKAYRKVYPLPDPGSGSVVGGPSSGGWPVLSDGMAVHPKQIAEAMELDRRRGVPTDYTEDGRPILRDRDHRRRFLRSYSVHDNDGGYGDG